MSLLSQIKITFRGPCTSAATLVLSGLRGTARFTFTAALNPRFAAAITTMSSAAAVPARKIYFAGSIRGGRDDSALYEAIISRLQTLGTVLTEHVGSPSLTSQGEPLLA